jgi:hypothetical protein
MIRRLDYRKQPASDICYYIEEGGLWARDSKKGYNVGIILLIGEDRP